jgi:hypothetical protein
MPGPARLVTSSNCPLRRLRYRYLCSAYGASRCEPSTSGYTWPFEIKIPSQPSLSTSRNPTPSPDSACSRQGRKDTCGPQKSRHPGSGTANPCRRQIRLHNIEQSVAIKVTRRHAHARLRFAVGRVGHVCLDRRIRDAMARVNLPAPEFAQQEISAGYTAVRVTLRNSAKQRVEWVDSDASQIIGEEASRSLSESERRVVNYAAEQGQINVSDCFRILPNVKTWHAAKNVLMGLVSKGIFTDEGNPDVKRDPHAHFKLRRR